MKIDRTKLKKSSSEVPGDCGWLIEKLQSCSNEELLPVLRSVETWSYGKCELYHWIDVLDRFDTILEEAAQKDEDKWVLPCDLPQNNHVQELVVWVLHFTTLLVEHSFSRHLYSSVEHLITLLSSTSMTIVLAVLNLLYMFSKRSNFITRLAVAPRKALLTRLINLAEPWGGKENGFGLAQCCQNLPLSSFPDNATTLHYEFYGEHQQQQQQQSQPQLQQGSESAGSSGSSSNNARANSSIITIHIDNMQNIRKSPAVVMEELLEVYKVPHEKQMILFTHIRLAHSFGQFETRLQCVQARLQALSVLVYCNALQDNANTVLYSGLLDEFVEVLELNDTKLTEIKAATLRTLTSIIHLDRMPSFPKLNTIIDVTGASSYHGFLPVMVRSCISTLTATSPPTPNPFPAPLATALFSFLYHLASYEAGGEALVSCGMMESLISVVNWKGTEPDHITFVTRAVRVIDLITNLDMHAFQTHGGLTAFIKRLEVEVDECRKEQPFLITLPSPLAESESSRGDLEQAATAEGESEDAAESTEVPDTATHSPMDTTEPPVSYSTNDLEVTPSQPTYSASRPSTSTAMDVPAASRPDYSEASKSGLSCLPQRAALIKSMLNFLKKAIQEPGFSESMRHLMEGSLPASLKHIISNAEYYGASLFLLATDVVTVYVFGEPSLLSSLQDNGLTDVVLHALLVKDVPATREVLGSLPNVFSALCLNSRGLAAFVACKPFERLFKVLLSPDYLPAMRRRRSSDPMGDTASNLGNAMDELMRHQPSLKAQAMKAIVKLLEEVCLLGSDTHYICWKTPPKHEASPAPVSRTTNDNSSDEEEEEEEEREAGVTGPPVSSGQREDVPPTDTTTGEKRPVPLVDYVLNVMKFVDAILSNNSTDDHCKEFVAQKGLVPLLGILGLPNLPIDFPVSQACQSVASVCKSILNLAHESGVLQRGLQCLNEKLEALAPLHQPLPSPGGSVLLRELASAPTPGEATAFPQATPLLHTLSAVHAYIMMLVHVCRTGQTEIRQVSINQWGTELGLRVLAGLTQLYTSLVWESTVLLALCSDDALPAGCLFGKEDTDKLLPPDLRGEEGSRGEAVAMEVMETDTVKMGTEASTPSGEGASGDSPTRQQSAATQHQMKLIKPLLSSASRLGKALAELFGLLVKLCVGSPLRQRRGQQVAAPLTPPTTSARAVASALANLLHAGLSWSPPPASPLPKFRLTFLICSVRFTNPMLFDDKKMPYHLMLQYFMTSQGLKAFFDTFEWAISAGGTMQTQDGLDSGELPEGTGEFLDTWLFLLERLVNPRTMLDSPHSLPAKSSQPGYQPFSPLKFLIHIQKLAFEAVMKLWNKKPLKSYGVRISESVLVILCSVLKGETIIQERLALEKETTSSTSTTSSTTTTTTTTTATTAGTPATSVAAAAAAALGITNHGDPVSQAPAEPEVNQQQLQALMDMGFPRERCLEAIAQSHTLQQATEYLLMNPIMDPVGMLQAIAMSLGENVQVSGSSGSSSSSGQQASSVSKPPAVPPKEEDDEPLSKSTLDKFCECVLEGCLSQLDVQPQMVYKVCELLTTCATRNGSQWRDNMLTTLINQISSQAGQLLLSGTLSAPESVELLCSSALAAKFAVRLHLVTLLFEEMKRGCARAMERAGLVDTLINLFTLTHATMAANPPSPTQPTSTPVAGSLPPAPTSTQSKEKDKEKDKDTESSGTPKWLSPGLLLLDLYEKLSIATKRRAAVSKICNHVWKWFDMSTLKWCAYSASNNKTIDDAYWAGETSIRIINGRRKYTIQFNSMVQVNEESGNRRPVMITIKDKVIAEQKKKLPAIMAKEESAPATDDDSQTDSKKTTSSEEEAKKEEGAEAVTEAVTLVAAMCPEVDVQPAPVTVAPEADEKMECEDGEETTASASTDMNNLDLTAVDGLTEAHQEAMIRACVGFIKLGVEPDTLHALMRLCLRITRVWEQACLFASLGGVRTLLSLTESSGFWGFHNLAALLMRHVLEEPATLRYTMEKVVRSSASNNTMSGAKELHYLLRLLAPAACRDPQLFTEITQQCLRIDLNMTLKRNLMSANSEDSILMKSIGGKSAVGSGATGSTSGTGSGSGASTGIPLSSEPQQLIHDLLEALTTLSDDSDTASTTATTPSSAVAPSVAATTTPTEERTGSTGGSARRQLHLSRSSSANDMVVQEADEQSPMDSESNKLPGTDGKAPSNDKMDDAAKKKKPLLSKSLICKLIAEFVRSYAGCAKLVTEHHYSSGANEKITEDCSALAYMLDHLVCSGPTSDMVGGGSTADKDTAGHVRVLIAALASCNHAPDAQTILVTEVKGALARATAVAESAEKHARLQALVGLICTMMEACPAQLNQPPNLCFKQQQHGMNNMIRVMVRKGLVTDLARIPHSLDLSSPNMAGTINAALKPLELVSRIVNLPSFVPTSSSKKKYPQHDDQQPPGIGTGTTNSEATRAQGDDNIEDTENTEHDISGAGESLEPTSDAHPNEDSTLVEGDEAGLEEILDQLLEEGAGGGRTQQHRDSVAATVTYVIDHDPPMDTDDTLHDSRMVTHSESQFLDEGEGGGNEEQEDSSSDSSEEREDEEADDDNDDEEVEEEEEEEEDGVHHISLHPLALSLTPSALVIRAYWTQADDDDEDEEEEEEGSVFDEGYEDLEDAFIRLPGERDSDDVLLLPSYQQYIDTIDTIIFGDRVSLHHHSNSHEDPTFMASTPNANPSGSNAIPTHPLFQNPREVPATASARLNSRPSRQRGVLRYHTVTPRTHTTTTTILQRLLGPSHRDALQLSSNLREATQVLFTNPDVRLMPPDPDEFIDMQLQDHGGTMMNNGGSSASLASVPNALSRWTEEARVLEADSMHDAVTVVKPALMAVLEKYRDAEQSERDKKKKEQEASKPPPASTETSQAPLLLLQSGDTEMGEATENNQTASDQEPANQETTGQDAAILSTASIAESIVESVLGTSSGPVTTTATPSFSGLLTLLSPVSSGAPTLPLQEPPVSSVPAISGSLTSGVPSAPATPQTTTVSSLPPFPSPATSTSTPTLVAPTNTSSLEAEATSSTLTVNDTEMVAASPLPATGSTPISQDNVEALAAQEETPMSVSPPEYPSQSPELLASSGDAASTPPLPQVTPRDDWYDPSMTMQQDPPQDQSEDQAGAPPELAMPPASESNTEGRSTTTGSESNVAGPSGSNSNRPDYSAILGDIEIPEGVDPSFLAALPEEMRQEVIAEQLRLQRVRQRATENTRENNSTTVGEVNPEFLAALPPNIQEEVLAQQRLEQQRQQAARSNPDDPVDSVSFLQTLPPSLRQTILADLEDSQFAALPPELAQEAQTLRRQREERNRHAHEHMFSRTNASLSSILRNTARMGSRLMHSSSWSTSWNLRPSSSGQQASTTTTKPKGRQLLDHEAMTCLLVLLFVDEPKLNTGRLHRVLRYLCHHAPTRDWVIKALLSILERCGDPTLSSSRAAGPSTDLPMPSLPPITPEPASKCGGKKGTAGGRGDQAPLSSTPVWRSESRSPAAPSWLSMSMDAALGCRASIFQIHRTQPTGKRTSVASLTTAVNIHPQASPLVCRHALDTLISLAKSFPSHFLPHQGKETDDSKSDSKKSSSGTTTGAISKNSKGSSSSSQSSEPTDFWELLVKLDSISVSRKGKGLPRTHSSAGGNSEEEQRVASLEASALGQLIQQLAHPVIRRSSLLTDRLLRLLALISLGLPETADSASTQNSNTTTQHSVENSQTLEHLLKLAIQVLTSKSCSEEGLEDATALLLHLSHGPPPARDQVLRLLLQGAATLGSTVATHIAALLSDLRAYNASHPMASHEDEHQPHVTDKSKKGLLQDRFTNECIIISGATKVKPPCELQLASMSALTSKTSSQAFFLRTLKVIIQLRDAIRLSRTRRNAPQSNNASERPTSGGQDVAGSQESTEGTGGEEQTAASNNQEQSDAAASQDITETTSRTDTASSRDHLEENQQSQQQAQERSVETAVSIDVPNPEADNVANATATPQEEATQPTAEAMDVDNETTETTELGSLSSQLNLDELWSTLSECLVELGETPDTHAVLVLQPAVEAFFLVHASGASGDRRERTTTQTESREAQLAHLHHEIAPLSPLPSVPTDDGEGASSQAGARKRENSTSQSDYSPGDTEKFLKFAETHRTVLNQILRQSTVHLADGPFSVLVDHTRLLDFDIKRKYFRTELERADDGMRREDLAVHVRREHVFEDSFRELHRRSPDEWKNRFYIVFEGEEGQDAGGLLREWYMIISREIFNPMYALFCTSPGDRVTYMINPASHCNSNHLSYFKFVGRVIAKAIYDNKLLECYFTRSFYKHILGKMVRVGDMESEDYSFYQGLIYLLEHNVADLGYELTFSTEVQEFGVTEVRDLKPNGRNIAVTEETKMEYIRLVCQMKMTGAIRKQLNAFLEGFYDIIPKRLISIFNEQELELLISGLPTIDIDDLRANTEYHKYQPNSLQIQWFWRALRSFDQAERAKFLQFVTGTSKVPLQGFVALEGMNGTQKFQIHRDDRSTDRLPSAHTCFNQLDLPVYETYDKLRHYLLKAIHECSEGFGFA
ncbi:E3 ubiquitin-protein ligase HUWE1-like isoform X4 [Penaeus monodon]|uniref:E3 ubiquitin-protein ligase HUWE1-like isoform X4 n=1 Tax=Penaeus monodon TaxID=6687 RepID=UPI0018A77EA9|nr:E3 ubiquitin-protein ligase HUWE1-like isoform X4 [Penaeus monodon]